MSTAQLMLSCASCARPTIHLAEKANHILHLLLSVLTLGLWLPFWVAVGHRRQVQCTQCATRHRSSSSGWGVVALMAMLGVLVLFSLAGIGYERTL